MRRIVFAILFAAAAMAPGTALGASCVAPLPVALSLSSELEGTVPSASVGFELLLRNESEELIHDAVVAVNVTENATDILKERFVLPARLTLLPAGEAKTNFVWRVPPGTASGTYTVSAALSLDSLPRAALFSRALRPAASARITVAGGSKNADISLVRVNGAAYETEAVIPIYGNSAQVIAATVNSTEAPFRGTLTWRLYAPGAPFDAAPLDVRAEEVKLHAGTSVEAAYALADLSAPGYYLEAELSDGSYSSLIDVRIARSAEAFVAPACDGEPGVRSKNQMLVTLGVLVLALAVGVRYFLRRKNV